MTARKCASAQRRRAPASRLALFALCVLCAPSARLLAALLAAAAEQAHRRARQPAAATAASAVAAVAPARLLLQHRQTHWTRSLERGLWLIAVPLVAAK